MQEDIESLARLGVEFKSDTYKIHIMMIIGLGESDEGMREVLARRSGTAVQMEKLEVKLGWREP